MVYFNINNFMVSEKRFYNTKLKHWPNCRLKSKVVEKGLRKALGLKKGEDVNEFLGALQVEGIDMKDI